MSNIRVCALDGTYAKMTEIGLPLLLVVELQSRNLCLEFLLWTAVASYSVTASQAYTTEKTKNWPPYDFYCYTNHQP